MNDTWKFNVVFVIHNHAFKNELVGHPIICSLKSDEKEIIPDMSLIRAAPKNILADLKQKRPKSVSNIKQIYNACYRNNMEIRGSRSEMQQLLKLLDDNHYVSRYKVCEDKVTVRDIFWTHPESLKLFNTSLNILIIDSTYKTNKYKLPLLKIIGVTSTEKTFLVEFAFLKSEKEVNVTWTLEMCKTLSKDQENMLNVIVTDRDIAMMNSIAKVCPTSYALLCRYHITKNVSNQLKLASNLVWCWKR